MLIEGEKYACEACVRGHRVSTCQHNDRPLTHINKKGRPVSQCPHCRGLRKARASHVACECGAKPHSKDDHESESKSDQSENHSDTTSDTGSAEQHSCCCSHGLRCTCAIKKEHLDPVPELDSPPAPPRRTASSRKPRLLKADSENALTVFTNGHHKPVHKHNDSAHKCGVPYTIPIPHSIHGNSDVIRHKSTDSLPLFKRREEASIRDPQQELRLVRSAHGSPEPRTSRYRGKSGPLPPLDFSYPALDDHTGDYFHSPRLESYYGSDEPPLHSAGLAGPTIDWSAMDLPLDSGSYTGYSQPPSYTSFDYSNTGPPGVITPASSDAGDYILHNASKFYRSDPTATTSADERKFNRLSSSSFTSIPQTSSNFSDFEVDTYLRRATASPIEFEEVSPGMPLSCEAFTRHGFTVHDAQRLAHPETAPAAEMPTEALSGLSLPTPDKDLDAVWGGSFDSKAAPFVSQGQVENEWSR